jgi:hypothetical protein
MSICKCNILLGQSFVNDPTMYKYVCMCVYTRQHINFHMTTSRLLILRQDCCFVRVDFIIICSFLGQSFVNDPTMTDATEVKASVKLRFTGIYVDRHFYMYIYTYI